MRKNTVNMRSLLDSYQKNCDRISEIADVCEREQRERTQAESDEYAALSRENQILEMRMRSSATEFSKSNENPSAMADKILRENVAKGVQTKIHLVRDLVMVEDAAEGGIVPVKVQEILKPLTEGLILDKVGIPMPVGLAGDYLWPTYEAVEATIVGEGVELTDTPVKLSKLTASPERIGIAIPVTRETINQTEGVIEQIVRELIPLSVAMLLNKILFSTEKVTGATNLVGPFVGLEATSVSATPTWQELNKIKASVLATGVDGQHLCWVMTKAMEATLEGEPINSKGIFKPMIENHMLCGLPVFTTNYIGEGNIGLGDWRYQPMGLFGQINFIVDPYSKARQNAVDFVLNVNYGTTTLRKEAFALATAASE